MRKIIKVKGMCFGPAECADRIDGLVSCAGLLANAICGRGLGPKCPHGKRRTVEVEPIGAIAGLPVIAAGPILALRSLAEHIEIASAYDVMPYLARQELPFAYTFAADYSARGIEWALAALGEFFSLYKRGSIYPTRRKDSR